MTQGNELLYRIFITAVRTGRIASARRVMLWALLNELLAAGYSKTFLAKQLGSCAKRPSLQIQPRWITH